MTWGFYNTQHWGTERTCMSGPFWWAPFAVCSPAWPSHSSRNHLLVWGTAAPPTTQQLRFWHALSYQPYSYAVVAAVQRYLAWCTWGVKCWNVCRVWSFGQSVPLRCIWYTDTHGCWGLIMILWREMDVDWCGVTSLRSFFLLSLLLFFKFVIGFDFILPIVVDVVFCTVETY